MRSPNSASNSSSAARAALARVAIISARLPRNDRRCSPLDHGARRRPGGIDHDSLLARGRRSRRRQRLIRTCASEGAAALQRLKARGSESAVLFVDHSPASGPIVMAIVGADCASAEKSRGGRRGEEERGEAGAWSVHDVKRAAPNSLAASRFAVSAALRDCELPKEYRPRHPLPQWLQGDDKTALVDWPPRDLSIPSFRYDHPCRPQPIAGVLDASLLHPISRSHETPLRVVRPCFH